jgi:site-specific DNA-methyltransferase (adenine-specific)
MELPYFEIASKLWNPLIVALLMPLSATLRTDNWTTACKWDSIIPFDLMWAELKRIIKPNWAIVLFGSEPFSSALRMSNIKMYKYDWIWEKSNVMWFLNAKKRPLKEVENICVFNAWKYFPQWLLINEKWKNRRWKQTEVTWKYEAVNFSEYKNYPRTILKFKNERGLHPTQKPVALMEYLIKTYTNEWETVLDFTAWSGTTWVACQNTNRNYILIEKDEWCFEIAKNRLEQNKCTE